MTENTTEKVKSNLAHNNLGRDLLRSMVDVIRTAQKPWHSLTEKEQEQLISRLRDETDDMVRKAINTLLTGEFAAVPAKLHQMTVRDGIKVVLEIDGAAMHRHEMVDAEGKRVLLVIADPGEYLETMDQVKADADQPDMFEAAGEAEPLDVPPPAETTAPVPADDDGLPEGLGDPVFDYPAPDPAGDPPTPPPLPDAPPPVQHQKPIGEGAPDDLAQPENPSPGNEEPDVPPAANEATLVDPPVLREKLGKIQIDVPEAIIEGWQANERLTALRFATAFWEAVQLEEQPPQPPYFLMAYRPI